MKVKMMLIVSMEKTIDDIGPDRKEEVLQSLAASVRATPLAFLEAAPEMEIKIEVLEDDKVILVN